MQSTANNFALHAMQELSLARTMAQFVDSVERLAREVSGAAQSRLYRYDAPRNLLIRPRHGEVASGIEEVFEATDATVPGRCALQSQAVEGEAEAADAVARAAGLTSHVMALPVTRHGSLVGVLSLTFTLGRTDRVDALNELCQVAGTIDPFIVRREDFQTFTTRTQDLLIRAVEFITPEGEGHVLRVASVASELAALLDLSARTRQLLWQASLYHDVGKVVLAGADASEVHRFHAGAGADYLRASVALQPVAALVETHQERWDGSGVPHGLKGDAVPIEGWVLALAEDLDEFRHRHRQLAFADWIERFYDGPAASHHPEAVEALSELVDSGKLALA